MSMTCAEAEELMPWVANGTAPAAQRAVVHGHVATCATCRRDLAGALALQRRIAQTMGSLPEAAPDAGSRIAQSLAPPAHDNGLGALDLVASALRALGAPPVLTAVLRLSRRAATLRPTIHLPSPVQALVARAAVTQ